MFLYLLNRNYIHLFRLLHLHLLLCFRMSFHLELFDCVILCLFLFLGNLLCSLNLLSLYNRYLLRFLLLLLLMFLYLLNCSYIHLYRLLHLHLLLCFRMSFHLELFDCVILCLFLFLGNLPCRHIFLLQEHLFHPLLLCYYQDFLYLCNLLLLDYEYQLLFHQLT